MSKTIDLTDPAVQTKLQDLRRKNEVQRLALENMASQLDSTYSKGLEIKLDALKEETILYVRDFFDQLKKSFTEYCHSITEHIVMSPSFSSIYSQVIKDQKLLDDIQNDINRFSRHFVLKESFDNYVNRIERTHQKYADFSKAQLTPEVKLAREEDFFKKLQILLKEGIRFENNLVEFTSGLRKEMLEGQFNQGGDILNKNSDEFLAITELGKVMANKEATNYDISYLHYFQEGSKKVHILNLERKVLVWDTIDMDLGFDIPLFSATIAARRDCILLAGGIDNSRKTTLGNVYVLNHAMKTLLKTGEMVDARNNFALVRLKDKIYAVGGCNDKVGKLRSCESVIHFHPDADIGQSQQSRRPVDSDGISQVSLLQSLLDSFPRSMSHQVWRILRAQFP